MKLTTKGRYAVTAMMDLALHASSVNSALLAEGSRLTKDPQLADNSRVTLTDIAERQGISLAYLEQLFACLRKSGLVNAVRGPGGGYAMAKPADEISVAAILTAVDENLDLTCGSGAACGGDHDPCLTHGLWSNLSQELYRFLDDKKLSDIIKQPQNLTPYSQKFSGIPIKLS